jgi:putative ABC transport system permease protein
MPGSYTALFAARVPFNNGGYFVRVDPAQRDAVVKAATSVVDRRDMQRILDYARPYDELRERYGRGDRTMIELLAGVIVALLVVTAFGIVGLASFWVQQRTRMIGTRRALGATRAQIRHYFQAENLLLTTVGIVFGMAGAYGINQWLMTQYELPRLPALYLPVGAALLWALGQVAVLAPARRAAAVPPALAMRGLA